MKKFIAILLLLILVVTCFCGCNMSLGMGNFSYDRIHIDTYHYSGCIEVDKWYENSTGIEVKTENGESLFLSEGTYILVEEDCPFCGGE